MIYRLRSMAYNGDKVVNAADIVRIINIIKNNSSSGDDVNAD